MKLDAADIRKIRGSLALCLLLIAGGAGALILVEKQKLLAGAELARAEKARAQAQTRLRQVSDEEQEVKQRSAQFQLLLGRGIIGEERRLDWIELLREIRERHRLFEIDYEIAPQQKLGDDAAGGYEFRTSTMKVQVPLLHEEDLLRLIADLQVEAPALLVPRQCRLDRRPPSSAPSARQANLEATCTLQWITIAGSAAAGAK